MPLVPPFPGHTDLTTFADLRRDLEGLVVRDTTGKLRAGVFPDHLNPLVTGRSDMRVNIADFRAVQRRNGAVLLANVGADTNVTLAAAPAANKRIDLVYATMRSTTLGDSASTPVFGVVQGTPSATPVVPPLPANLVDALPLATVEIPAGATTTLSAGVVITQVYPYTALAGGTVVVRNSVELAAWAPADGSRAFNVADTSEYVRSGGTQWVPEFQVIPIPLTIGIVAAGNAPVRGLKRRDGSVLLSGQIGNGNGLTLNASYQTVATLPTSLRPLYSYQLPASAAATGSTGSIQIMPSGELRVASTTGLAGIGGIYMIA